jgi:hypothetical protein
MQEGPAKIVTNPISFDEQYPQGSVFLSYNKIACAYELMYYKMGNNPI